MAPRLKEKYNSEIRDALREEFKHENPMQVGGLVKIVVNMGVGEAVGNPKALDAAVTDLTAIAGQKPQLTRAKKSLAAWKLREGMPIGCKVTLRGTRMYQFLDKFMNVALPRVRDFRGVSEKAFDGRGNYAVGLREQLIFPEIDFDKIERISGMNISIVTSANTDSDARALLTKFGMPFRK